jgi:hypothetical protein
MLSNHLPTVPQDSFYRYHTPEELALAHANLLDFDHPDALDMPMFAAVCAHHLASSLYSYRSPVIVFSRPQGVQAVQYPYLLVRRASAAPGDKVSIRRNHYHWFVPFLPCAVPQAHAIGPTNS